MNTQAERRYNGDASDLRLLFDKLVAKRWWVVASIFLSTAIFITAAFVITPVYRASTVLISASAERDSLSGSLNSALGQLGGLASLAGVGLGSSDAATEEALAVLRSRQFTERFISDANLMPELFSDQWDVVAGNWKEGGRDIPTPAKAFKRFRDIRTVTQDKKTGLVILQVDWTDRNKAAAWANELAQRLNSEMRNRAIEKAEASVSFLEKELASTSVVETRQAINRLIEAQIKQRMLANVTKEYAFRVVDKAMAPDSDDPFKPQKLVLIVMGPLVGIVVGILCVLVYGLLFRRKPSDEHREALAG